MITMYTHRMVPFPSK